MIVRQLNAGYGDAQVLHGLNFEVGSEPIGIVGRNGMGKTTLCAALLGMGPRVSGSIRWRDAELVGLGSDRIARHGIAIVPQGRRVFRSLTVDEHLRLVHEPLPGQRWTPQRVYELFPRLADRRDNRGHQLSGGEQQMLAIGRALLRQPEFLVLDEPSEGLAPVVVVRLVDILRQLSQEGMRLLVVEQNLQVAAAIAPRVLVMVSGQIALDTDSRTLVNNSALQSRFLGVGSH